MVAMMKMLSDQSVVIDFAVDGQDKRLIFVGERLSAGL